MKDFPKVSLLCGLIITIPFLLAEVGLAASAVAADSTTPARLQGEKSYWVQNKPQLSRSQISRKLTRPHNVQELLRNLYIAWNDRLLVEPKFYDDSVLMICFNGAALTWKDRRVDPNDEYSNRVAEMKLDDHVFAQAVVVLRLYREKVQITTKAQTSLPAHQHYMGYFDLSLKGVKDLTWEEVTRVFGSNAMSLPLLSIDDPGRVPTSSVALMRYSYPGDDPAKFGDLTLPQTRIWLEGWRPDVSPLQNEGPRNSDNVTRILMLEVTNRIQGEE